MPIAISDYRSEWPKRFSAEAARIAEALGPIARRIEHVCSTAVPGLAAKDTIDIQVSVYTFNPESRFRRPLETLGYVSHPDDEPAHRFFKLEDADGRRRTHVHVCESGSEWEQRHLMFRDYLRTHPEAAHEYEELKRDLAPRFEDANDYADAKTKFIRRIEQLAHPD